MVSATHTAFLLYDLQNPLGRKQEVDEAAEPVSAVLPLHHAEELPQDGGSGGSERAVQGRQSALDAVVQRLSVLEEKRGWSDLNHMRRVLQIVFILTMLRTIF